MVNKISIITEIASTHNGSVALIKKLADHHLKFKSDYLKFQIFKSHNLYKKNDKEFKVYKKIEVSFKNWKKLINFYSKKTKLILEPFDSESYTFCKKFKDKIDIKISTSETDDEFIVKDALKNFKRVFINLSGYNSLEIKKILSFIKRKYKKKIILMYGFQSYPTKPSELRFNLFNFFNKKGFTYGYADHSINGLSKDLIDTSAQAIYQKCKFIEKHICLSIKKKPHDYISALEPKQFYKYLKIIKNLKKTKKFNLKRNLFSDAEKNYANNFQKKAFSQEKILKNQIIYKKKVIFLRGCSQDGFKRLDFYKKKKLISKKLIEKEELIKKKNIIIKNQ